MYASPAPAPVCLVRLCPMGVSSVTAAVLPLSVSGVGPHLHCALVPANTPRCCVAKALTRDDVTQAALFVQTVVVGANGFPMA